MAEQLTLDIVTPEQQLFSKEVSMVVVPGAEGEFGVLADHAPLISNLKPGVVRIYDGGKIAQRVLVTGGFVEVTTERCTVLANEAFDYDTVNKEELQKRLEAIKRIHDEAVDESKKMIAAKDVDIAQEIVDAFLREADLRNK